MTNTLHRYGKPESLKDDYIVFAMASRGHNEQHSVEKLKEFLRLALKHGPVNVGNGSRGSQFVPSRSLNMMQYILGRNEDTEPQRVVDEIDSPSTIAATYDNKEAVTALLSDLKKADIGISVNVSGLADIARSCCEEAGITRHSVEYSLLFRGALDRLPDRSVLELSTMCGHGMLSFDYCQKLAFRVKEGRQSPATAARLMSRFCSCGVFNPVRAERLIREAAEGRA